MTLAVGDFRAIFPEFADATAVPDAVITFNLNLAYDSLNPIAWGDRLDAGAGYYAAHYVSLAVQRMAAAQRAMQLGQSPGLVGAASGLVTSKSVGGVSKSMDVSVGQSEGGGILNTTVYGQSYLTLLDSVAVGAIQF